MPEAKAERQEQFLNDSEIADGWKKYQRDIEVMTTYFHDSGTYQLQTPTIAGKTEGTENDSREGASERPVSRRLFGVVTEDHSVKSLPLVIYVTDRGGHREPVPVPVNESQVDGLMVGTVGTVFWPGGTEDGLVRYPLFGRQESFDRVFDQVVGRIAQHILDGWYHEDDRPLLVDCDDSVRNGPEDLGEEWLLDMGRDGGHVTTIRLSRRNRIPMISWADYPTTPRTGNCDLGRTGLLEEPLEEFALGRLEVFVEGPVRDPQGFGNLLGGAIPWMLVIAGQVCCLERL